MLSCNYMIFPKPKRETQSPIMGFYFPIRSYRTSPRNSGLGSRAAKWQKAASKLQGLRFKLSLKLMNLPKSMYNHSLLWAVFGDCDYYFAYLGVQVKTKPGPTIRERLVF